MQETVNRNGINLRRSTTYLIIEKKINNELYEFKFNDSFHAQQHLGKSITEINEQDLINFSKENKGRKKLYFYK